MVAIRPDGEGAGEGESAQLDGEKEAESRKGKHPDISAWYRYMLVNITSVLICQQTVNTHLLCVLEQTEFHIKVNTVVCVERNKCSVLIYFINDIKKINVCEFHFIQVKKRC